MGELRVGRIKHAALHSGKREFRLDARACARCSREFSARVDQRRSGFESARKICARARTVGCILRRMLHAQTNRVHAWLRSPLGARVYALERKLVSEALAQVFGWQLLQIGLWGDDDGLIGDARTQRKTVLAWHGERGAQGDVVIRSRTDALAIQS